MLLVVPVPIGWYNAWQCSPFRGLAPECPTKAAHPLSGHPPPPMILMLTGSPGTEIAIAVPLRVEMLALMTRLVLYGVFPVIIAPAALCATLAAYAHAYTLLGQSLLPVIVANRLLLPLLFPMQAIGVYPLLAIWTLVNGTALMPSILQAQAIPEFSRIWAVDGAPPIVTVGPSLLLTISICVVVVLAILRLLGLILWVRVMPMALCRNGAE